LPDFTVRMRLRIHGETEEVEALAKQFAVDLGENAGVVEVFVSRPRQLNPGSPGRPDTERETAKRWLVWWLRRRRRPVPAAEVFNAAKLAGIKERTLRRAAEDLHIVKTPPVGPQTAWSLPKVERMPVMPTYAPDQPEQIEDGAA
jgi:hypothetical protein